MTRAQLSTLVLSWLDDEQQGYFNANDVNTWLNLAQRQVQQLLLQAGSNWYVKPVETLTVINQADYLFPSDFMIEHRIEIITSGTGPTECRNKLIACTLNEQDFVQVASGTPDSYFIKKDRFTIMPMPSNQWTMRLYYSPLVADMQSDSDSPDVPEQFMEFVAILACFDGFIKDDRAPDNLVIKKAQYLEILKQMAVDRTQDHPRRVVNVQNYDWGGYF